jgi:hypothetical protein
MSQSLSLVHKGSENTIFGKAGSGSDNEKESEYLYKAGRKGKEKKRVRTIT